MSRKELWICAALVAIGGVAASSGHPHTNAQALRTCVDRWNQSNMISWGPGRVNVAFRRPNTKERSSIELSSGRQCIVAIAVSGGTWTCLRAPTGAYWCPPLHEPTGPRLPKNATLDERGRLRLDTPLNGTHPAPPLAWQRYPHVDGYIHPWTRDGVLRRGLRFRGKARGRCFLVGETARDAVSCLFPNGGRAEACFPQRRPWRRGDVAACSSPGSTVFLRWLMTEGSDPPVLVPWKTIGGISLDGYKREVESEYGVEPAEGYRLHGSRVRVGYDRGRVAEIQFATPYYRTRTGFGVGSRIPLGPCHKTTTARCEHRWHGFVWNAWAREKPCSCWVKVGRGRRSLAATTRNFLKPWTFIDVRRGRVSGFYFALKFVD